ncbi:hypothetical protein IAT38_003641 [Cryptococcus sp. DSM 104549]
MSYYTYPPSTTTYTYSAPSSSCPTYSTSTSNSDTTSTSTTGSGNYTTGYTYAAPSYASNPSVAGTDGMSAWPAQYPVFWEGAGPQGMGQ